jgi:hypothetical protein
MRRRPCRFLRQVRRVASSNRPERASATHSIFLRGRARFRLSSWGTVRDSRPGTTVRSSCRSGATWALPCCATASAASASRRGPNGGIGGEQRHADRGTGRRHARRSHIPVVTSGDRFCAHRTDGHQPGRLDHGGCRRTLVRRPLLHQHCRVSDADGREHLLGEHARSADCRGVCAVQSVRRADRTAMRPEA